VTMRDWDPRLLIFLGIVLMLAGILFPGLIVLHYVRSTWALNFFSYTASVLGVILGFVGVAFYTRRRMP